MLTLRYCFCSDMARGTAGHNHNECQVDLREYAINLGIII
eukprot:COSAG01_NODE_55543_length_324_cov_0.920000_1_plen_39_part_01